LLAQKGNFSKAFTVSKRYSSSWIIDSRHDMRCYYPWWIQSCNENFTIHIADGSSSQVKETSISRISKDMTLNSILHVSNLDYNLLSINCVVKFFHNLCIFQDLDTGKKIDSVRTCSRLYLLKGDSPLRRQT
jgi:hypothetical protein